MNMQTPLPVRKIDDEARRLKFRNAMARLGAAVNIVTTDGGAGRAGFTASAVCSVTDSPPSLLVCLNRSASVYPTVSANQVLCVNVLESGHEELSRLFGGKTPQAERFEAADWSTLETGSPVLTDALISFDCRITTVTQAGTHDVMICEVDGIRVRDEGKALVYFDRSYHHI